jgi:long-subunit acyl-CoA synthetase (AMP-forming)
VPAKKLDRLLSIPILGRIVGRKVLKGLGLDQVLLAASGSAPIPPELISWYRRLGLNLMEGYAMTEDFAYSHASTPGHAAPGCVGTPMPGVEVRLSDEQEILLKSPGKMVGYYKRPDLNAEVFTPDGFFRTGDQGERTANGLLKLTGRVKELFKTSKGKYIAPAPIENMLNAHEMIEICMVSGVGQPTAYAIVVLAETLRPRVGAPEVRAEVDRELTQLLKDVNLQLADYEQLRMLVIAPDPWSIENGYLTPTMKIRRNRIETAVQGDMEQWYASKGAVHWA